MTARWTFWAVAALYLALTFLLAYPLSVTAHRTLPADDPDGHLFMWTLAWDAHAFVNQPLSIFDANIFYPNSNTLAYSENLVGSALFAAPALWLTANPVLAVNVVSLLSCALCGLGAYVLGRRVGLSTAAAVLVGLVFAFSPPRFFRFSQLHLTAVQWIPFALGSLHAYLDNGRKRDLHLATAFFALQAATSGHGAVFAAVAIVLLVAYRLAVGERLHLVTRLHDFGLTGILLLIPAALFAIPYQISQVEVGLRRALDTSATPIQRFLASPTRVDVFLQSLVTSENINGAATAWLFPGVLPVLLALVAVLAGVVAVTGRIQAPSPVGATIAPTATTPLDKLSLRVLAIALFSWMCLGAAPRFLDAGDGLTMHGYDDARAAWTGYVSVDEPGRYIFNVPSGTEARLTVDNTLVFDRRAGEPDKPRTAIMTLGRGSHRVLLEIDGRGAGNAGSFSWALEGTDTNYRAVPSWALSQQQVSNSRAAAVRTLEQARGISVIAAGLAASSWVILWLAGRWRMWIAWVAPYRTQPTACYLLLTVACVALAIGPPYGLWQFVYWLPGFNFIRGATRFMVLGLLGVAVLAGIGFDRLTARLGATPRRVAAVLAGALLIIEFWPSSFEGVPYRLDLPDADRWVAQQPKPFSVAEVPVTASERYHSNYMLHSMAHWQKTVHGYSGLRPRLHQELYGRLRTFPSEDSVRHLAQLGVTYVIVHSNWFTPEERTVVEQRLPLFSPWLKLEYSDADSRVYSIDRRVGASQGTD